MFPPGISFVWSDLDVTRSNQVAGWNLALYMCVPSFNTALSSGTAKKTTKKFVFHSRKLTR